MKYIYEAGPGELASSGRKPILLKINPAGACILAADLQPEGFNIGCFDLSCNSVQEKFIKLNNYEGFGDAFCTEAKKIIKECDYEKNNILGICIGAPGIIDRSSHKIISSTVIPVDSKNDFFKILTEEFTDINIELMNESSLSAYTENEYNEELRDIENLLFIDVHEGIGAGIIINGDIYEGAEALAGEFGHISIDVNGPICKCGSRGCLEVMANIPALVKDVEALHHGTVNGDFEIIAEDYREKDRYKDEIERIAIYLAYGINSAMNLMNPGAVVIGGKIRQLGEGFLKKINEVLTKISLYKNKKIRIILSKYEGNPVTAGGARYMFNKVFEVKK
jgi:predicted NBD/HSP70 family sugar kinase